MTPSNYRRYLILLLLAWQACLLAPWFLTAVKAQPPARAGAMGNLKADANGEGMIPAEVQDWADEAIAAYEMSLPAEALRLQQRVVAWVRTQTGTATLFQANALASLGLYLGAVGSKKEAEAAYEEALRRYQELRRTMPADALDRPAALQNLSRVFSELGRQREALQPQQEAVQVSRERAKADPAMRKDLAARLHRLGELYRGLDLHQDALPALEEAGALYQQLDKGNRSFLSERAAALDSARVSSVMLGQKEKALSLAQQTVALSREILAMEPADSSRRAVLANQLAVLGSVYHAVLNQYQQALVPLEEAVQIYRDLVKINPDFQPGLANSLLLLGNSFNALGRHQDALTAAEEAAERYQQLAQRDRTLLSQRASALDLARDNSGQLGQREKALSLAMETVALRREIMMMEPTDNNRRAALADSLLRLGVLHALGLNSQTSAALREAERIYRDLAKSSPTFRASLAEVLLNMSKFCSFLNCEDGATLATAKQAVQIYRELAVTSPAIRSSLAEALTAMANAYMLLNQPRQALAPVEEAVRIDRGLASATPAIRWNLAFSLALQAQILTMVNQPQNALAAAEEAVTISREGSQSQPSLKSTLALGNLLTGVSSTALGEWERALASTQEAVDLYRESAKADPLTRQLLGVGLMMLGLQYSVLGRDPEAKGPLREALLIRGETKVSSSPLTAAQGLMLSSLGRHYSRLGQFQLALAQHQEAAGILRQVFKTNPEYAETLASALEDLGDSLYDVKRYSEALALYQEALQLLRQQDLGSPLLPDRAASTLASLGMAHHKLGQQGEAIASLQEAIPRYRRQGQTNALARADLASTLSNLGAVLAAAGKPSEALAPSLEAVAIHRELARSTPVVLRGLAGSATNLANLQRMLGEETAAVPLLREAVSSEVLVLQRQLPLLPEMHRQALVDTLKRRWEIPFSLARQSEAGASLALFTRLNRFSPLQDIERRQAILSRASATTRPQLERLNALTANLANPSLPASARQSALRESEALQDSLYRQLPALAPRLVEVGAVAQRLPPDGVLLEFQRFTPHHPGRSEEQSWDKPRYLALVLDPGGRVQAADLGEAEPLELAIAIALDRTLRQEPGTDQAWAQVAERVFLPLRGALEGRRQLLISPDGQLHRVPFGSLALLTGTRQTLPAGVTLQTIVSGRDLVPVPGSHPRPNAPLVLADPATNGWAPLARAASEGEAVATRLGVQAHLGPAAAVSLLEQARGPRILHVAAHGYFEPLDSQTDGAKGDPLLASGLALAGAVKQRQPGRQEQGVSPAAAATGDDGYLTAQEAARLQLEGTDLVVLSACETGLGSYRSGEGLFGLQRSLTVAGARGTLLSLWKVPEHATETFMSRFYTLLGQGIAPAEAVRQVQHDFRTRPRIDGWSDPYYWAGWQYSGTPDVRP